WWWLTCSSSWMGNDESCFARLPGSTEFSAPSGRTLTPPTPSLPASPPPAGREGAKAELFWPFFQTNHSLFSRRTGGRLGEEGRGDEGPTSPSALRQSKTRDLTVPSYL